MNYLSIDLETLDKSPGGVILSIGAVFFNPNCDGPAMELGPQFYSVINVDSCKRAGFVVDADTLAWWAEQSEEARQVLAEAQEPTAPMLGEALGSFGRWIGAHAVAKELKVVGNGSSFDNAFLDVAYARMGMELPWKFWNHRDLRTYKDDAMGHGHYGLVLPKRQGTHHNALDDAVYQAQCAGLYIRANYAAHSAYQTLVSARDNPRTAYINAPTGVVTHHPGDIDALGTSYTCKAPEELDVKAIAQRFLSWRLPDNFNPDCGISFKKTFNDHLEGGPNKYEPSGTNLFDAAQAEEMVRHILGLGPDGQDRAKSMTAPDGGHDRALGLAVGLVPDVKEIREFTSTHLSVGSDGYTLGGTFKDVMKGEEYARQFGGWDMAQPGEDKTLFIPADPRAAATEHDEQKLRALPVPGYIKRSEEEK